MSATPTPSMVVLRPLPVGLLLGVLLASGVASARRSSFDSLTFDSLTFDSLAHDSLPPTPDPMMSPGMTGAMVQGHF